MTGEAVDGNRALSLPPQAGRPNDLRLAITAAQAALQRGDTDAALAVLADALARYPAQPRLGALARQIFLSLSGERRVVQAHQAFGLLHRPPEPLRLRHALALLDAGMMDAAAVVAAGLRDDALRARFAIRVARAVSERPEAVQVFLPFLRRGSFSGATLRVVCGALAQAGEAATARRLLALAAIADPVEAALCEATLLRGEGRLDAARRRIAPLLDDAAPAPQVLTTAYEWAREALDLASAADLAERLLSSAAADCSMWATRHLAKFLAEQGRHAAAWRAMDRLRADLVRRAAGGPLASAADEALKVSLQVVEFAAAEAFAARVPPTAQSRRIMTAVAWSRSAHPPTERLMRRAEEAWADPSAAMARAITADVAIVHAAGLLPSIGFGRAADGGPPPVGEQGCCHYVMARTLDAVEQAGLTAAVVPSPGYAVPPELLERGVFFVSYHSFSGSGAGVHVKLGALPGTVLIDPTGYSGWTSACALELADLPLHPIGSDAAIGWLERERARVAAGNLSKWEQRPRNTAPLPSGPAVMVALQIPRDNALRHAWVDMFDLARAVVGAFRGGPVTVVLKRHPKCRDPRTDALLRQMASEPHVLITDASIHDLLPAVQAVYCVNSGLGAEALLYGRSVHVAGMVDYRHACHEIRSLDDLLAGDAALRPRLGAEELARYLYWFRNLHHVPLDQPGALDVAIAERILRPVLEQKQRG
ncbi:MAG: hypothetical protein ACK4PG_08940 [Acetobacteraceae bacterium]